jgi:predicted negative regulator of RcsB-dependent stress response
MPRRKIREELKREDFLLSSFEKSKSWIGENLRLCIVAALVIVLLGLSGWAFTAYKNGKNDRAQYFLATGIAKFQEYTIANKADSLSKAEADFKQVVKIGSDGPRDAAQLYLAQIALTKGKKEEAKALYKGIVKKPSNDIVKKLAETGLSSLEKN